MSPLRHKGGCQVDHRIMEVPRSIKDKAKASRTGSRLQNRACDQCRRAKRRCDLAEAGVDGGPIQNEGPCKLCIRKNLECTSHWSQLQQTVSSSRQELRHISQTSATYTALQNQLTVRNIGSVGLSSTTQSLNDSVDNLYIAAKQLSIYITAWEWTWLHYLGPSSAPLGVGIDVIALPRFGLLSSATNRCWDSISRVHRPPHISPNFFFTMCACDEAYRHKDRFKRPPPMAEQISNQALQYAILAYASQFGSQAPKHSDAEANKAQKEKDLDIAEAAWTRARNFIMTHATVHTFRMAYALHLFSSTCPPLRSARAESNPTLDAVFALQTGLKMLDELATELRSQQLEDLYTMGYFVADGTAMDESLLLSADPDYRNRVSRSKALIGVAENLLWYSVVCDAAAATSFGLSLAVRGSSGDDVDLKAIVAAQSSWIHAPGQDSSRAPVYSPMPTHPTTSYPPGQVHTSVDVNIPQSVPLDDCNMLHMIPNGLDASALGPSMSLRSWEMTHGTEEPWLGNTDVAVEAQFVGVKGPWTVFSGFDAPHNLWTRIVHRVQKTQKRVPAVIARLRAAPSDACTIKEFLALLQTAASAQVMIWQRTANFRHRLGDHNCSSESLVDHFHRAFHMGLYVQSSFQPALDLDPQLYYQLPASAQTMVVMFINNAGLGMLHFLWLCSTLEGSPWLQSANENSWPRASMILQDLLRESRQIRTELRRKCALRITLARRMVQEQVKCTLFSHTPSQTRESSASAQSSYSSDQNSSTNGSRSEGSSSSAEWYKSGAGSNFIGFHGDMSELHTNSAVHHGSDLPQTDMLVSPLQIHTSRHPVPTILADSLHMSFCALVPDALQEISQDGVVSPLTLDSLDSALLGLQDILGSVLNFGPFYHRDPSIETLFSTRNWLAPDRPPMTMAIH